MLKIDRISRGIIVAIYIVVFVILPFSGLNSSISISFWSVAITLFLIAISIVGYISLNKKLERKITSTNIIQSYRYVYLSVLVILSRLVYFWILPQNAIIDESYILFSNKIFESFSTLFNSTKYSIVLFNAFTSCISVILINKIMTNIFENNIISMISSVLYIFSPCILNNSLVYNCYSINLIFMLSAILCILRILDDVYFRESKSKKYIFYAIILGIDVSFSLLFGGNVFVWLVTLIIIFISAGYIDKENIKVNKGIKDFFEKIFSNIFSLNSSNIVKKKNGKKTKYKIIKVNKAIIVMWIVCILASYITIISSTFVLNPYCLDLFKTSKLDLNNILNVDALGLIYLFVSIIILISEILCIVLKRKIDRKDTVIHMFVITSTVLSFFGYTGQNRMYILDSLLPIAMVLSVVNIYYNRDEKVKMLEK